MLYQRLLLFGDALFKTEISWWVVSAAAIDWVVVTRIEVAGTVVVSVEFSYY